MCLSEGISSLEIRPDPSALGIQVKQAGQKLSDKKERVASLRFPISPICLSVHLFLGNRLGGIIKISFATTKWSL